MYPILVCVCVQCITVVVRTVQQVYPKHRILRQLHGHAIVHIHGAARDPFGKTANHARLISDSGTRPRKNGQKKLVRPCLYSNTEMGMMHPVLPAL